MQNSRPIAAGMLLMLFGASVYAGTAPAQWYSQVTIRYVYAGKAGGRIAIGISTPFDAGTCPSYGELVLDQDTNPYFKSMMAMILSAYTADKTVSVFTDGTCTTTGVALTDVRLP